MRIKGALGRAAQALTNGTNKENAERAIVKLYSTMRKEVAMAAQERTDESHESFVQRILNMQASLPLPAHVKSYKRGGPAVMFTERESVKSTVKSLILKHLENAHLVTATWVDIALDHGFYRYFWEFHGIGEHHLPVYEHWHSAPPQNATGSTTSSPPNSINSRAELLSNPSGSRN